MPSEPGSGAAKPGVVGDALPGDAKPGAAGDALPGDAKPGAAGDALPGDARPADGAAKPEGGAAKAGVPLTERGARTRERLLAAAREVFEERGFLETRVAHIAGRANVAYGSFYTYFPSKEAVFLEVADRLFADMTRHDLVPSPGPSPADRIRQANRAYYEAYTRNARMMAIVEQVATFNEEFQELRRKHRAATVRGVARAVRRWQAAGSVPADLDPELAAHVLSTMVDHSLYLAIVQGDGPGDRLLDTLDTISIRALGLEP